MPYSRQDIGQNVLAVVNTRLFGTAPVAGTFDWSFAYSDDSGSTWTSLGFTLKNIYDQLHWSFADGTYPMQMVFQTNPSNSVYIATSDAHMAVNLYNSTTQPISANGWQDFTPPTPKIPYDTHSIGRYTCAMLNGTVLFYAVYNFDDVPDYNPYNCANLYRYDCTTKGPWVLVLSVPGSRHMHAVEVDPTDSTQIYAVSGDGNGHGVFWSPNGGLFFLQIAGWIVEPGTNTPVPNTMGNGLYGIDMTFPPNSDLMFIEADGQVAVDQRAMILSINRRNLLDPGNLLPFDIQLKFPPPSPPPVVPDWRCSIGASLITSDGDLFFISGGENGAIGLREGVWWSQGPDFNTPVLLEDLAPPVIAITENAGTITVTTTSERNWNTQIFFSYYDPPGSNNNKMIGPYGVYAVPASKAQFSFPKAGNPPLPPFPTLLSGVARLFTGWNYARTFEFGGYLFNAQMRMTPPDDNESNGNGNNGGSNP